MNLNLLIDFPFKSTYYLTHPWIFIKHGWYNLKNSWQRIIRGYSRYDVMDMDFFFLEIIPPMLREIANSEAYPADEEFPTYESWQNWCNDLAAKFEDCKLEKWEEGLHNEYYDEWQTLINYHHNTHPNLTTTCQYDTSEEHFREISRLYFEKQKESYQARKNLLRECYLQFATHHDMFWI